VTLAHASAVLRSVIQRSRAQPDPGDGLHLWAAGWAWRRVSGQTSGEDLRRRVRGARVSAPLPPRLRPGADRALRLRGFCNRCLAGRPASRYGRIIGPDIAYLNELLEGQLAFLLAQAGGAAIIATPGFLQALRRDPRLAIHLGDLHAEAERLGERLQDEEHDKGNPAKLLELAFDEAGTRVPREQLAGRLGVRMREFQSLLGTHHHPFVLPFPSTSSEALGRISSMLLTVDQLAEATPEPIVQMHTSGHQDMAARNERVQEHARVSTRTDPAVALLRLEAVESLLLSERPYAEPPTEDEHTALRVQVVESAVGAIRAAHKEPPPPALTEALRPAVDDIHRAAQLLVLDLRRRLYTARSRVGVVLRFKARCEWHDRERLRKLADDAPAAKQKPEHVLRDELNRYLFDQGLNPLAETVLGTSSRADVFDPSVGPSFYVEAKQYGDRAGVRNELRGAFRQALDTVGNLPGSGYAIDEVFVVLFRRGGPRALLPTDAFAADGLRWYFVLINIAEASGDASQNPETPEEYTAEKLRKLLLEVRAERARGTPASSAR
jgi:hypothetical protein